MQNRNVVLATLFLVATFTPTHFHIASAESFVRTKDQCTRYGGRATRNTNKANNPKTYPWACSTPSRDRQCAKKHGKGSVFDAEFGNCSLSAQEAEDCYIFDDCW